MTGSLSRIRLLLAIVIIGLVLSGVTAFPLETEIRFLSGVIRDWPMPAALVDWVARVEDALSTTNESYPFLAYGTDWLAFAHLVIAVAFFGPWRDPVRNRWIIDFGLIACAGVIPLALIAGEIRGIPWFWRMIDCSFGVFGAIPLWLCRREIDRLEARQKTQQ